MIVVDSSVWIARLRRQETPQAQMLVDHLDAFDILLGDIVLMELLQGARDDLNAARLLRELREFEPVAMMSPKVAVAAARNYRHLRALGFTIRRSNDLIIATFCIENNHQLLQQDRDFLPFARHLGLRLV